MRSTIDSGGRVVIPKSIRARMGLVPGSVVEVAEHDGRVEISPAEAPVHLVEVDGAVVGKSAEPLPPLTDEVVRETLERTRRRSQSTRAWSWLPSPRGTKGTRLPRR